MMKTYYKYELTFADYCSAKWFGNKAEATKNFNIAKKTYSGNFVYLCKITFTENDFGEIVSEDSKEVLSYNPINHKVTRGQA